LHFLLKNSYGNKWQKSNTAGWRKKNHPNEHDTDVSLQDEAVEEDGTPVLDEEYLEENDLDDEEADDVEWEDSKGN
jgi:hypothetical protein